MTDNKAISPLRERMTEDMTVRDFTACTQRGYIAAVRNFTVFLGRPPDQADKEDLRRFQQVYFFHKPNRSPLDGHAFTRRHAR